MKPSLSLLLLAGVFCTVPSIWADSISFDQADSIESMRGSALKSTSWHETASSDLGPDAHWNVGFDGTFTPEDAAIDCSVIDQSFDFPQSNSSGEHQLSFVPKWGPNHRWGRRDGDDSYWMGSGHHDGDKDDHGIPTFPTPEPESLWLFMAGIAVVGLCSLLRRAMPKILSQM